MSEKESNLKLEEESSLPTIIHKYVEEKKGQLSRAVEYYLNKQLDSITKPLAEEAIKCIVDDLYNIVDLCEEQRLFHFDIPLIMNSAYSGVVMECPYERAEEDYQAMLGRYLEMSAKDSSQAEVRVMDYLWRVINYELYEINVNRCPSKEKLLSLMAEANLKTLEKYTCHEGGLPSDCFKVLSDLGLIRSDLKVKVYTKHPKLLMESQWIDARYGLEIVTEKPPYTKRFENNGFKQ